MTAEVEQSGVKRRAVVLLSATFFIGVVTGAGATILLGPPPPGGLPPPPPGLGSLDELGLDQQQRAAAEALHEKHRPELEAIFAETMPKVRGVQDAIEVELRALLTPEQRERLDAMRARRLHQGPPPPHP